MENKEKNQKPDCLLSDDQLDVSGGADTTYPEDIVGVKLHDITPAIKNSGSPAAHRKDEE